MLSLIEFHFYPCQSRLFSFFSSFLLLIMCTLEIYVSRDTLPELCLDGSLLYTELLRAPEHPPFKAYSVHGREECPLKLPH